MSNNYISQEAKEYSEKSGLFHFETSAKRNINLSEVFLNLAKKIPEKTPHPTPDGNVAA